MEDPKVFKVVEMRLCNTAKLSSKDPELTSLTTHSNSLVARPWRWTVGGHNLDPAVMLGVVQEKVIVHHSLEGHKGVNY